MTKFLKIIPLLILITTSVSAKIKLGIDVLENREFDILRNKRVGLLTNPAGVNSKGISTIDVLRNSRKVNLVALYGPEHGVYGKIAAEEMIASNIDPKTNLPVYSLYGTTRKPTPEILKGIDVMVVDLQDVGVRCYTYISCLLYTMESCFENGIEVVVLDRPNPLGGLKVDGPVMDYRWMSYVGSFLIPHVHGLTIGEIALIGRDSLLWLKDKGKLTIVPMNGWTRDMLWPDTELTWIPTSPNIPSFSSVVGYPMTGLGCQAGGFKHGFGSKYVFRMLSYPGKSSKAIKDALDKKNLPGLKFNITNFKDYNGKDQQGIHIVVTDWKKVDICALNFHLMQLACEWAGKNPFTELSPEQIVTFNKHVGSDDWWQAISTKGKNVDVLSFQNYWHKKAQEFQIWSKKYWLYDNLAIAQENKAIKPQSIARVKTKT